MKIIFCVSKDNMMVSCTKITDNRIETDLYYPAIGARIGKYSLGSLKGAILVLLFFQRGAQSRAGQFCSLLTLFERFNASVHKV